jgi:molybdopterin molybdotransferase
MEIEIQLTSEPIAETISPPPFHGGQGARLEFRGVVRGEEDGQNISALEYEAYPEMAEREIRRILESLAAKYPCLAAKVIHRIGVIPVGDTAIYVGVASPHRGEAIALLAEFMDRLKQDVPIWKRQALGELDSGGTGLRPVVSRVAPETTAVRRPSQDAPSFRGHPPTAKFGATPNFTGATPVPPGTMRTGVVLSLNEALADIQSRCQPPPAVRVPLAEAFGRMLRETVCAPEDLPPFDRSTRDGYAIQQNDESETFRVVDALHAADWKPQQLKSGEAVRVATGAAMPCENLRVVMQENVERSGDQIRIVRHEGARNVSVRGEDLRAGASLLQAGARLDAGAMTLLATAGNANPLVSPRLRVVHFTTGDEIIPPGQTPKPGQIRDSNSYLIRGLLQQFPCDVAQKHLPENFEQAKRLVSAFSLQPSAFDLLLVSGGASVGEKDFTRPLLEWLGFEIVFNQINVRPGRPLIFGTNGTRVAFGLPGNPLSHFVCFHLFVATALAKLVGEEPKKFQRGRLAAKLDDAPNPRETLWPARLNVGQASCLSPIKSPAQAEQEIGDRRDACPTLTPLKWASSGDVTCLAETNALVRVPANRGSIEAGAEVDFLPANL